MKKWITKSGYIIYQIMSGRSNVFLISNGINNILVDTSVKNRWTALSRILNDLHVKGGRLSALVLTHSHFDHVSNAALIKEKYNTRIIVHEEEIGYLSKGETSLPKGTVLFTKIFSKVFGNMVTPLVKYRPVDYDILVEDRYDLNEFGFKAHIIHTPGHTDGSISVIIDDETAIVGDTMFGIFKKTVFPYFADNPKTMIESWKKLLETGCVRFLPSHGTENSRDLLQKQYNKYKKIYKI